MPVLSQLLGCDENESYYPSIIQTSDGTRRGTPTDVTGWTVILVIHADLGDQTPLKSYAGSILLGIDGLISFAIPNADIAPGTGLGPGDYYYFIARTDVGSEMDLARGVFIIDAI